MKLLQLFSKITPFILVILLHDAVFSQAPQGFSYQAVVRNSTGAPIGSQTIGVKVTLESPLQVEYYSETQSAQTNAQGVFNITVGAGTRTSSGLFKDIPWANGNVQIKVAVDITGSTSYTALGNPAIIQSVPYALYANPKEITSSSTANPDDPIFEVKNKDGKVVFGVYQTGVRVYVEDSPLIKGAKGGFAVGGLSGSTKAGSAEYFRITSDSARIYINNSIVKGAKGGFAVGGLSGSTKGKTTEFLRITPDSTRIYIDDTNTKGAKGGFAVGGLSGSTKGLNKNFFNIETGNNYIINPSQARILWYPLKNALLTGEVLIEDPSNVGLNSFASGYKSKAKGQYSQALGYQASALGDYSTAIGKNVVANSNNSFAFGDNSITNSENSYAFGKSSTANGQYSFAFGEGVTAGVTSANSYAFAFGKGSFARANSSYAFGDNASTGASATNSYAFGQLAQANGVSSYSLGNSAVSNGNSSYAFGDGSTTAIAAPNSFAFGKSSQVNASSSYAFGDGASTGTSATNAFAFGKSSQATGISSYAFGDGSISSGANSFAFGRTAKSIGNYSFALGDNVTANNQYSYAFGKSSSTSADYAVAMGNTATASGIGSFAVNGSASGQYSKAFGGTASGNYSLSSGQDAIASGTNAVAMGYQATASGDYSFALGWYVKATSDKSLCFGMGQLNMPPTPATYSEANGVGSIALGSSVKAMLNGSIAIGAGNQSTGVAATALGFHTTSQAAFSTVIGSYNVISGNTVNWVLTDPLFVVGNGDPNTGTPSNALTILKNGKVGIGTYAPTERFHVKGTTSTDAAIYMEPSKWSSIGDYAQVIFGDGNHYIRGEFANGLTFYTIAADGFQFMGGGRVGIGRKSTTNNLEVEGTASKTTATAWLANSDRRIKTDIKDISNAYETILKLRPVTFKYTNEYKKNHPSIEDKYYYNFIAQEFQKVFPDAVKGSGEFLEGTKDEILQLDSHNSQIVTVKAVQELILENQKQQKEIDTLKAELEAIKNLLKK